MNKIPPFGFNPNDPAAAARDLQIIENEFSTTVYSVFFGNESTGWKLLEEGLTEEEANKFMLKRLAYNPPYWRSWTEGDSIITDYGSYNNFYKMTPTIESFF